MKNPNKLSILLACGLLWPSAALAALSPRSPQGDCRAIFLERNQIQSVFFDPEAFKAYQGMSGYAQFAERVSNTERMDTIYRLVQETLGESFRLLKWPFFNGRLSEVYSLPGKILDKDGRILERYRGMDGYARFADEHFKGSMMAPFFKVSAVLGKKDMKRLGWRLFQGRTDEFYSLPGKILDKDGRILERYRGMAGYARFADEHFDGNMDMAFRKVSVALTKKAFEEAEWQKFDRHTNRFYSLPGKILDEKGHVFERYWGMAGYARFAEKYFYGDMQTAFTQVSAALDKENFLKLNWQAFPGQTDEFYSLPGKILDKDGHVFERYRGMAGLALFADERLDGNMRAAFTQVSALLNKKALKKLNWRFSSVSTDKYRLLNEALLDKEGDILERYRGMAGLALFADERLDGNMRAAFNIGSAMLGKTRLKKTGWHVFPGRTDEFYSLRGKILDEHGRVFERYWGMDGLALFADERFDGNIKNAFTQVSAVLGGHLAIKELGLDWKLFRDTVLQYKKLIQFFDERSLKELRGIDGQRQAALLIFKGSMRKAYRNGSLLRQRLLDGRKADFDDLGWSPRAKL